QGYAYYWDGNKIVGVLPAIDVGLGDSFELQLPMTATCERRSDGVHCILQVPLATLSKDERFAGYVLAVEIAPAPLMAPKRACLLHNGQPTREAKLDLTGIEIKGGNLEPVSRVQETDANGCYQLPTGLYDLGAGNSGFTVGSERLRPVSNIYGVNFEE